MVSAGTAEDVVLPNSKVKVKILLVGSGDKSYPNNENFVIPDYKVSQIAKDLVSGVDAELNFTVDLIKKIFLK